MKIKRKKKLINYSFQLKTAIPAVLICLFSFSAVIGFIVLISDMSRDGSMVATSSELNWAVQNEDNIVSSFKEYAKRVKDPIFILATEKIEADHIKSIAVIKDKMSILKAYSERNSQLLAITVIVMVLNAALLFLFLIRSTHRAAGPVHLMNRYVRDLLEGRDPDMRKLRTRDEFKDFYEDFSRLVEKYRKKKEKPDRSKTDGTVTELKAIKNNSKEDSA
jgi:hypothetical protein